MPSINYEKIQPVPERAGQTSAFDPDWIHEQTKKRIEYFEIKQLNHLEKKEREAIREQIGKLIRDKCRAEIDDYYDCMVSRSLTFLSCRTYAKVLQQCVKRYERSAVLDKTWQQVAEQRQRLGLDRVKRSTRKQYNKYISDTDGTGWLPKSKSSPTSESRDNI